MVCLHLASRPSVRCVHLINRAVATDFAHRTFQQRSQTANALKSRRYHKSAPSAGELSPMLDLMNSSHQRTARASLLLQRAPQ